MLLHVSVSTTKRTRRLPLQRSHRSGKMQLRKRPKIAKLVPQVQVVLRTEAPQSALDFVSQCSRSMPRHIPTPVPLSGIKALILSSVSCTRHSPSPCGGAGCLVADGAGDTEVLQVLGCYSTRRRLVNDGRGDAEDVTRPRLHVRSEVSAEFHRPPAAGVATRARGERRKACNNGTRALGSRAEG